jgi:DNA-binding cell septation regulator SpoVG
VLPLRGRAGKATLRVLALRRVERGTLKASADVALGQNLTLYDLRVIQQPGQRAWVSPPQREWTDAQGQRRYTPLVDLRGDLRIRIERAVLAAYEAGEGRHA